MEDTSLLIDYITHPWRAVDDGTRDRLITICQDVIASLETPLETARKNSFLALDHAALRSAVQLDIFALLASREAPWTTQDLAAATTPPCEALQLSRLLCYLSSPLRMVAEEGPGLWRVTKSGRAFADPKLESFCALSFDSCSPAFQAVDSWVSAGSSSRIVAPSKSALPSRSGIYDSLEKDGLKLQEFTTWIETLAQHRSSHEKLADLSKWIPENIPNNEVALVDIRGGKGRQFFEFREKHSPTPGRIVIQESAEAVQFTQAQLEETGTEVMTHNIFNPQPVKGAHVYHFREVFRKWPPQDVVKILGRTKDAMEPHSALIIDEVVLPEEKEFWSEKQNDPAATALLNAGERSKTQWRELLRLAGLRVEEIYCYDPRTASSLIVGRL